MRALIAVLGGDGIGPEVVSEGARVLEEVARARGHEFELPRLVIGGAAVDQCGQPLPEETWSVCKRADAVLFGAVGGPKWDGLKGNARPERGLLGLRRGLNLYANLRPVVSWPSLEHASAVKPEIVRGTDIFVVRELTGGIYFGEKRRDAHSAVDVCSYSDAEVTRIVRVACRLAQGRKKSVTSVDKENALETSKLWREVATRVVHDEFPDLRLTHMLVDTCALRLIRFPQTFDVVVTENMFGDILTDEAAVLAGSVGMLPSASLGEGRRGLYEPVHGSAPDIAGKGIANPYGTILSVAMLLRHTLELENEARSVEAAVRSAVDDGFLTADVAVPGGRVCSTSEAGRAVIERLRF